MKERTFYTILLVLIGVCLALSVAHLIYIIYAYQHSSIIYFVGKELW